MKYVWRFSNTISQLYNWHLLTTTQHSQSTHALSVPCLLLSVYVCVESLSHVVVSDSAILWAIAHQAPLSMEFSR